MRLVACGASVIGPHHLDHHQPNQDAMTLTGWRGGWLATVADGLGSRPHSDVGSRCACQVGKRVLKETVPSLKLAQALQTIHAQWINAIAPYEPRDMATTLLLSSITANGKVHAAQLGDGLVLLRFGGQFQCMTPRREGYGNQTWALESAHQPERWQTTEGYLTQTGDGVVLMTDGIADDLDPEHLSGFMVGLYEDLRTRNRRNGRRWLENELTDWSTPGHSDDKTLVAIFRTSQ